MGRKTDPAREAVEKVSFTKIIPQILTQCKIKMNQNFIKNTKSTDLCITPLKQGQALDAYVNYY